MRRTLKALWKVSVAVLAIIGLVTVIVSVEIGRSYGISIDQEQDSEYFSVHFGKKAAELQAERIELLKEAGHFATNDQEQVIEYVQDSLIAQEIHDYFRLDTLYRADDTTWAKALAIGSFVARHIPHDNQKEYPKDRTAIGLWQYTKEVAPAFNCRLHSILTYELLMSAGIINRFVTCLPYDSEDSDCHVVNEVWLPELNKWAMLDTDSGGRFVTDEKEVPLSLLEMRERYITGGEIIDHPEFGAAAPKRGSYYSYMAKNSYWYIFWSSYSYGKENMDDAGSRYLLVPKGFDPFRHEEGDIILHDAGGLWSAPTVLQARATPVV